MLHAIHHSTAYWLPHCQSFILKGIASLTLVYVVLLLQVLNPAFYFPAISLLIPLISMDCDFVCPTLCVDSHQQQSTVKLSSFQVLFWGGTRESNGKDWLIPWAE